MAQLLATMAHDINVNTPKQQPRQMNPIAQKFQNDRWVYLSDAITRKEANDLTEYMFSLLDEGKLEKDDQCPLSDSVYGAPVLDSLLERLAKPLSTHLNIDLIPTYTYARIYRPGEVLERHTDRPSCEISGTMTLGFDPSQKIWPIFFAKNEDDMIGESLNIGVGDLVMYRGNELPHWRPKFKGTWQVQVFFHYVDANGPHKDYKYDGRKTLGIEKTQRTVQELEEDKLVGVWHHGHVSIGLNDNLMPGYCSFNKNFRPDLMFTREECDNIIALANGDYSQKAGVGTDQAGRVALEVRNVNKYIIEYTKENEWIFDKIARAVATANAEYYKYEIMGITHGIELLHYEGTEQGHYDWHTDTGHGGSSTRKISVSVQLTDSDKYEGGNLEVNCNGQVQQGVKEKGSISLFPSYALHRVSPVTSGERWVLVIWIHGSSRFK
jgi:PKHD-type hydroxylase